MNEKTNLSPPWYTLRNEIKCSVGYDRGVAVGPLDTTNTPYIVPIAVSGDDKAVALASIMNAEFPMGNITVAVQVKNSEGVVIKPKTPSSAEELGEMVKTAFGGNALFSEVVVQSFFPGSPFKAVYAVFDKSVIQFYNDDLSDLYRNFNRVAAFVFREVLNPAPGGIALYCSTVEADPCNTN